MTLRLVATILTAVLLVPAVHAAPMETQVICGFESDSDTARFSVRVSKPPSTLALTADHVTQGSRAASAMFPKWQQGSEEWPAIIITTAKGLPPDWSEFDAVAADVYNASAGEVDLGFYARDNPGTAISEHVSIPPGASRPLRIEFQSVSSTFDLKRVKELHIFATRPPEAISIVVDNIRLESNVMPRLRRAGTTLASLKGQANGAKLELEQLWKELDAAYASLTQRAAEAQDVAAVGALRPEVIAFEHRLDTAVPRAVCEARLRVAAQKSIPYACGFASSIEKVFPRDVPFTCSRAQTGSVELAGGETESIQLLVYAFGQDLKNTRIEAVPLGKPNGKRWPVVQVSPVGFVETKKPPYPVRYVGWHPDPILDFLKAFEVKKGDVQPVWIRVTTDSRTPAADYRYQLVVRPENAPVVKLGLKIHVWGFDIPKERHLRTAMSLYDNFLKNAYGTVTEPMLERYEDFVLSYRINPDNIYRPQPPPIESLRRWDRQGLNAFNIVCVQKPKDLKAGDPYPADQKQAILDKIDAIVPQLKKNGLYSKAYVYGFDEIGPESYAAMKDIFGVIKTKYPDLLILTTGRDHSYGVASKVDAVDAWCPLTPYYDPARVKDARSRGKQVWWYICIGPKAPYANWLIEYDAIDARVLMGLQTAKYQPDGFLYYAMMRWPLTKKPITDGPFTDWPPASYYDNNGDGSIICAGPDGPLTTIRLENIRDGIEDYEYHWLLREEAKRLRSRTSAKAKTALSQVQKALEIGDDLVLSMSSFTKSPDALLAKRRQMAAAIVAARMVR